MASSSLRKAAGVREDEGEDEDEDESQDEDESKEESMRRPRRRVRMISNKSAGRRAERPCYWLGHEGSTYRH
jgi:hypothetical protein